VIEGRDGGGGWENVRTGVVFRVGFVRFIRLLLIVVFLVGFVVFLVVAFILCVVLFVIIAVGRTRVVFVLGFLLLQIRFGKVVVFGHGVQLGLRGTPGALVWGLCHALVVTVNS
jgi:hypothetical protein